MPLSSCPAEELGIALLRSAADVKEPEQRAKTARFFRAALVLLGETPEKFASLPPLRPEAATAAASLVLMLTLATEHADFLAECVSGIG